MTRQAIFALATAVLGLFYGQTAEAEVAAQPELVVTESVFNFGAVTQGAKVEHSFEIANLGTAPLVIKGVQPACGCTAAVVGKNTLEPQEKTQVSAIFDTTGFQGYKVKTIRLHTNDPKQSSAVIGFQGTVKMDVELDQPRIYFGTVNKGSLTPREISVRPGEGSSVQILDASSRSEHMDLVVDDIDGGGKKLRVSLKETVPIGIFKARIVVRTTSERNPVINVPVFARVEGDLKLIPSDVSFGLLEGPLEKAVSHKLRLVNSGKQPIQVVGVKSTNPAIEVTLDKVTPGKVYELTVTVQSGSIGPLRGQIKISTDHADAEQSEITLPVYGIITRKGE